MKRLSLVVPTHNSEKNIEKSLRNYYKFFKKKFRDLEIIVSCNNCTDNTEKICHKLKKELPIIPINVPLKGKGHALIEGFNKAKYDIMGFIDDDNPFDLNKIIEMTSFLKNSHVAIVSKYLKGKRKKQEYLMRRILSLGGSIFSKMILGLKFRDTQAGAKFFRREVWEKLKKEKFICIGFDWDMEFLYKVRKANFRIAEVYIPVKLEKFSTVRLKLIPGMIFRLLKLRSP
jgi:dolichol-phosphate mannosyltransferase